MKCYRDIMQEDLSKLMAVALLLGMSLSGCQSSPGDPNGPEVQAARLLNTSEMRTMSPPRMALAPGDVIEIKFFYTPQLNDVQTVRPDGRIALQLVGEVDVQQKTPAEVRRELLELYAPHVEQMEVAVIVRSFWNRRVFVGGQVIMPGIIEMPGEMTVLEAIIQAGGFDMREAEVKNVVVIRHRDGQRYGHAVDLRTAVAGERTEPFLLEPQDIVYVPRTQIAKVNQWIDQHINKIIPDTGMFFRTTRGRTTIGMGSYR